MPRIIKAILCDVDGTIIDSFSRGFYKLRLAAERFGYDYTEETERIAIEHWGAPLDKLLLICFPDVTSETARKMRRLFVDLDTTEPPGAIAGALAVLELLAKEGIVFTVLTSRDSVTCGHLLRNAAMDHYFIHVAAQDTTEHHKPDPRVFACTMEKLKEHGIEPDECVLIGDTYDDWKAGQAFGMRTVIVKTGPLMHPTADIPEEDHIQSFAELPDWLSRNNF
ncbi:MAG TPA: HAD family hydrolase [Candidatus Paceibacterota bacterium]|nr:HAD family hydrolase [Candidatus Paceibacterota bacterium]